MDRLFGWLRHEPAGRAYWVTIVLTTIAMTILANGTQLLYDAVGISLENEHTKSLGEQVRKIPFVFMLLIVPAAAFFEEVVFRLPLAIFLRKSVELQITLCITVLFSVVFGLSHGGWWNVPAQGLHGFIMSLIFLKCGGIQRKYGKAILASWSVHLFYNWFAFGMYLIWGI